MADVVGKIIRVEVKAAARIQGDQIAELLPKLKAARGKEDDPEVAWRAARLLAPPPLPCSARARARGAARARMRAHRAAVSWRTHRRAPQMRM